MAFLSFTDLLALAQTAGFIGDDATIAAAVAMAESGGNPNALGDNGQSYGLWQIYVPSHPGVDVSRLYDPTYNSQIAKSTFDAAKASRATNYNGWKPWSTFNNGAYKRFMPASTTSSKMKSLLVPAAIGTGVLTVSAIAAIVIRRARARSIVSAPVPQAAEETNVVVPIGVNRCRNMRGQLDRPTMDRLLAVVNNPSQRTWNNAYTLQISTSPMTSLWSAVTAVDPSFPKEKQKGPWRRFPSQNTLVRAIQYACR